MDFEVTGDIVQVALPPLVDLLQRDTNAHACIFVNFRHECATWAAVLENLLANLFLNIDVLQINGDMKKMESLLPLGCLQHA